MRFGRAALLGPPLAAVTAVGWSIAAGAAPGASPHETALGAELYTAQCASCHGPAGEGVEERGPPLTDEGPAAVDFVLRTGRMPMANPSMQPRRQPVRLTDEEIDALVAYAGALGDGPAIPDVDPSTGDVAAGGVLYRLNCAACHVASGAGAAIGGRREAPEVLAATPTEVGEAILIGPGSMPSFRSFSPSDIDDVAAYLEELQAMGTTSAVDFGGAGPVAEGLSAWLLGLIPLIAVTRWIGTAHEGRDRPTGTPARPGEPEAAEGAP